MTGLHWLKTDVELGSWIDILKENVRSPGRAGRCVIFGREDGDGPGGGRRASQLPDPEKGGKRGHTAEIIEEREPQGRRDNPLGNVTTRKRDK